MSGTNKSLHHSVDLANTKREVNACVSEFEQKRGRQLFQHHYCSQEHVNLIICKISSYFQYKTKFREVHTKG